MEMAKYVCKIYSKFDSYIQHGKQFIKVRRTVLVKQSARNVVLAHLSEGTIEKIQSQCRNWITKHRKKSSRKF